MMCVPLQSWLTVCRYEKGDDVTIIWDPTLVEPFQTASSEFADAPFKDEEYLDVDRRTVATVLSFFSDSPSRELSEHLLSQVMLENFWGTVGAPAVLSYARKLLGDFEIRH